MVIIAAREAWSLPSRIKGDTKSYGRDQAAIGSLKSPDLQPEGLVACRYCYDLTFPS
jgi:hypothetical protein